MPPLAGAADGLRLALNVAAMLIAFLAFIALFNGVLGQLDTAYLMSRPWWPGAGCYICHSEWIFGQLFSPLLFISWALILRSTQKVGWLLGTKLVANEHVAYIALTKDPAYKELLSVPRTLKLTTFALTGFANFSSIGIQIGGIGGIAPDRRHDLAKLGMRRIVRRVPGHADQCRRCRYAP